MRSDKALTIIFVSIVAVILIGEAYVYTMNDGRYSSDITVTDTGIDYSLTSKGSEQYSVLVLDNGAFEKIDTYYIYYDEDHGTKLEKPKVPVGAKELTLEYHISQLVTILRDRGVDDVRILNAADLAKAMTKDLPAADAAATKRGLVVLSGALPDTIYTGNTGDLVFDWIDAGGSLYWAGNILGAHYSTSGGGIVQVSGNYEEMFFGAGKSGVLNTGNTGLELSDVIGNDHRYSLSLMNSQTKYGIKAALLGAGDHLAVGYTDGTYGSSVMVKRGDGMICVLAGDHSNEQRHDLAQLMASGISAYTDKEAAGYAKGEVKRGTVTGTIDVSLTTGNNYTVYIYYGGYFTVYGKTMGVVP